MTTDFKLSIFVNETALMGFKLLLTSFKPCNNRVSSTIEYDITDYKIIKMKVLENK